MSTTEDPLWKWLVAVALAAVLIVLPPGRAAARGFFNSLRLEKPQPVTAGVAAPPATGGGRQIDDVLLGMVGGAPTVTLDEPARAVPTLDSASKLAGFTAHVVSARHDAPTVSVVGARELEAKIDRSSLRTVLDEAGEKNVATPAELQGAVVRLHLPRAVQLQYGHCPVATQNTIQGQLQGPPPPSTDYGDCLVLTESEPAHADAPTGLDMPTLVRTSLELSGMSPNQTQAFEQLFGVGPALALGIPRFMRSYDSVRANGISGMLMSTAGRRGPTYALAWSDGQLVYELTGYGFAAQAAQVASTVR